jgi:D-alanyl-D-alanine carboxypeptidase
LSRLTTLSARQMVALLQRFRLHRELLTPLDSAWVKTGTLAGVQSLAGYFPGPRGEWLALAVMLNGPQAKAGARERILALLQANLAKGD